MSCDPAFAQARNRPDVQEQEVPEQEVGEKSSSHNSADAVLQDLAALKDKLRAQRAQKEAEEKRQIKFRELRELIKTLRETLDEDANADSIGQASM